jgi:hypothetical protein
MFTLYQEGIKGCVPLFGKLVLWLDKNKPGARGDF